MVERLRIAVVGTGPWWGREHARVFSRRPDVELCAIVGRTLERAEERTAEFPARPYADLSEMLDREKPDLVSVCLPNEAHFEPTMQVIEAGVPLLVEKPFVFELDEADRLLAAAAQRGLFFAINFNHRYARPVVLASEAIGRGDLGRIVFATWRFGGEAGTSAHPHANLIETQCHGLDMLEHLCGPIRSVMAQMTDVTGRGYSSHAIALGFESGAVGSLLGSYDTSYAYPGTHHLEVNGTEGRLLVEDTVRRFTLSRSGDETRQVWEAGYFNDRERDFHALFEVYVDRMLAAFRAGQQPPIHATAGRRALQLAHASIRSFESGERVVVTGTPTPEDLRGAS
ncbi:Gfo/Idh/MocA family protein [Nitriliruptor alkaliphilus]|uniref:Gfo/Idh/MocA family protein n=1 Tax=Nitriliruptor alkaliphilus TaxID=427918 RepID=UPI000695A5F7|nr:Gfo/Idh/MocA family oxidoreductase [Nitriliruptor alkaliphilus]